MLEPSFIVVFLNTHSNTTRRTAVRVVKGVSIRHSSRGPCSQTRHGGSVELMSDRSLASVTGGAGWRLQATSCGVGYRRPAAAELLCLSYTNSDLRLCGECECISLKSFFTYLRQFNGTLLIKIILKDLNGILKVISFRTKSEGVEHSIQL